MKTMKRWNGLLMSELSENNKRRFALLSVIITILPLALMYGEDSLQILYSVAIVIVLAWFDLFCRRSVGQARDGACPTGEAAFAVPLKGFCAELVVMVTFIALPAGVYCAIVFG